MNFSKTLISILAIFCIIVSAGIVCAADNGGYAGSNYQDMNGVSGSQYYVNNALEPGNGLPLENQTGPVHVNGTDNAVVNATGNATTNTTNTTNTTTANVTSTGNTTNMTAAQNMPVTGNPIMTLLVVTSLVGGYVIIRKNK